MYWICTKLVTTNGHIMVNANMDIGHSLNMKITASTKKKYDQGFEILSHPQR